MAAMQDPTQKDLIKKIEDALSSINFGSIEIHVQGKVATQITVRNIEKTSIEINNANSQAQVTQQVTSSQTNNGQVEQSFIAVHTHIKRN